MLNIQSKMTRLTSRLTGLCQVSIEYAYCGGPAIGPRGLHILFKGDGCNFSRLKYLPGEALNLPVDWCSNAHLWSWALGNARKNKVVDKKLKWVFFAGCLGWAVRDSVQGLSQKRERRETVEVVRPSGMLPGRGVPGISNLEETPRQTSLGNVLASPSRSWRKEKAREKVVWAALLSLLPPWWMDGWMDDKITKLELITAYMYLFLVSLTLTQTLTLKLNIMFESIG